MSDKTCFIYNRSVGVSGATQYLYYVEVDPSMRVSFMFIIINQPNFISNK